MKLKKLAKVLLVSTLAVGLLTGCSSGSKDDKTIKVGASPTPHAEILEAAKPLLEKQKRLSGQESFAEWNLK